MLNNYFSIPKRFCIKFFSNLFFKIFTVNSVLLKKKILSDKPEKHYSSRYDKDNQDDHTYLGLAFMTYS